MNALILGIDPGAHGALCLYDPLTEQILDMADMPTHTVKQGATLKARIDLYGLAVLVEKFWKCGLAKAVIEEVASSPQMGVGSAFAFGFAAACVQQAVACAGVPLLLVPPAVWKRALRVKATADLDNKDASRQAASMLLPSGQHHWALKKHDGRAEAFLLAYYGSKKQ